MTIKQYILAGMVVILMVLAISGIAYGTIAGMIYIIGSLVW